MSAVGPQLFKPFTKTKVVLSIEGTPAPMPIDVKNDLTAIPLTAFRDAAGQGPAAELHGPGVDDVAAVTGPEMFAKKGTKPTK
jgi:hypothetical protein